MVNIKDYIVLKKELIKNEVKSFSYVPKLVIVQVNDDPASNSYIKGKLKDLDEVGLRSQLIKLDINTTQDELLKLIDQLNKDKDVDGFIVQMPLPKQIDEEIIKLSVSKDKDVDGFNVLSKFNPATPNGIVTYLKDNNYQFDGKNALVIGRSNIVGKPMFNMLLNLNMTVTIAHSHTSKEDLKRLVANSDLIIVAVGKPNFITNEFNFKKGSYVFDVGINRVEGKLVGDCEPNLNVEFQSPVPGGVGLLTRLSLILNLLEVYKDEI